MTVRRQTKEAMEALSLRGFPRDLFNGVHHLGVSWPEHYAWACQLRGAGGQNPRTCERLRWLAAESRRTQPADRSSWLGLVGDARTRFPRTDGLCFPVDLPR